MFFSTSCRTAKVLEAEAGLEIDDSRSKSARSLTEVATADVIRNGAGVDIQRIEYIDEVGLDFDLGVFSNQTSTMLSLARHPCPQRRRSNDNESTSKTI